MNLKIFIITILLHLSVLVAVAQPYTNPYTAPGYVDPENIETCFSYMGPVDFKSEYKFISSYTGLTPPSGWTGGLLNPSTRRLYGFSIPLVGDLDGDGYPEIITMGLTDNNSGLTAESRYIYIYNGQTGVELKRFELPTTWNNRADYWHGAPSQLALVDIDPNDRTKEIIVVTGGSDATYSKRVIAYSIDPVTFDFTQKWISNTRYNEPESLASNTSFKAIPQIVDLDGDGIPEIVVYNKIYNAANGELLLELERLGSTVANSTAFVGKDLGAIAGTGDRQIGFNYVYDMDLDGIYDVVAGGKIYKITKNEAGNFEYTVIQIPNVPDGRTGVADINGDGIPDVVTITRTNTSTASGHIQITVWDPGFLKINDSGEVVKNETGPSPYIVAQYNEFPLATSATGNNSYVYIGDIDGRETLYNEKTYRLPEIAVLGGRLDYAKTSSFPDRGIPTTGRSPREGVIAALTFDPDSQSLKLSFVLEHEDSSVNTGFTMFDFDNDGIQEICYRDEKSLRIIKGTKAYITNAEPEVGGAILFKQPVRSYTGFEYPVIADIDNDASAEIVVLGRNSTADEDYSFLYAVGSAGDKFAPALPVWNQFMYDPFKINPDLTTPKGPAPNRLSKEYTYTKIIRGEDGEIKEQLANFNPYNGTLAQVSKFQLSDEGYEPIIFLTESYIVGVDRTSPEKSPKIVTDNGTHFIEIYVGNKVTAQTDIALNTPISIYTNEISADNFLKQVTLREIGLNSAIKFGQEVKVRIPIDNQFGFYIVRLGDSSDFSTPGSPIWKWGINNPGYNDLDNCIGTASRADRDCNWNDQLIKVAKFALTDDALTLQEYGKLTTNILDNDILPSDFTATFADAIITRKPLAGKLSFTGANLDGNIIYQHTGGTNLPDGIDKFTYQLSYIDKTVVPNQTVVLQADVFLYILKNKDAGFTACPGEDFTIRLANRPAGVNFYWYEADGITEVAGNPKEFITVPAIASDVSYKVKPQIAATNTVYGAINFPMGDLTVRVLPRNNEVLKWTGAVNSAWDNPANWQDDRGEAIYAPTSCVDAVVQKVTSDKYYPVVEKNSGITQLTLEDRAMIKNSYLLDVDKVKLKLKLKNNEYNRWISLSAPITNTYSGDFIIFENENQVKNTSYLSLYQYKSPNAEEFVYKNEFTRPMGNVETKLQLGMNFILYVDKVNTSNTTSFTVPTGKENYMYILNNVPELPDKTLISTNLIRNPENKETFLFTTASDYEPQNGSFSIPYEGEYILVSNPFPAMLDLSKFLNDNSAAVEMKYKIWGGTPSDNFVELKSVNNRKPTWIINSTASMIPVDTNTPVYIAPFQSFFLKTLSNQNSYVRLKFSPSQTDITVIDYEY